MSSKYSSRINILKESPTIKIAQLAKKMKEDGAEVLSLAVGEPDYNTSSHVKKLAIDAISNDHNGYTGMKGVPGLKEAIINKLGNENKLNYELDQICIGCGGKEVIFNAMFATLNSQDEVLIPSPYYVSYPSIVELCGAIPKILFPDPSSLKITPELLEKSITYNTKWLILNSPCNPSGVVYTKEELIELANVVRKHPELFILSDDLYEHLIFDGMPFHNILMVAEDLKERVLIVNGFSKSYAMTGWRVGYGAGSSELISRMNTCQTHTTYHTSVISQYGALAALIGPQESVSLLRKQIESRRAFVLERINKIPILKSVKPMGAFYLYVSCELAIDKINPNGFKIRTDIDFCEQLLEDFKVAVVPGTAFGYSPYFRISLTMNQDTLSKAIDRISLFCSGIK